MSGRAGEPGLLRWLSSGGRRHVRERRGPAAERGREQGAGELPGEGVFGGYFRAEQPAGSVEEKGLRGPHHILPAGWAGEQTP